MKHENRLWAAATFRRWISRSPPGVMQCLPTCPSSRLELRHHTAHEFIEQWHRERHLPMGRAVDHAFLDQTGAHRAESVDPCAQSVRDVARPVRAAAKLGHGAQVLALTRGEPVEPQISSRVASAMVSPASSMGSRIALAASAPCKGPTSGKLNNRSAQDFDSPASPGGIGSPAPTSQLRRGRAGAGGERASDLVQWPEPPDIYTSVYAHDRIVGNKWLYISPMAPDRDGAGGSGSRGAWVGQQDRKRALCLPTHAAAGHDP